MWFCVVRNRVPTTCTATLIFCRIISSSQIASWESEKWSQTEIKHWVYYKRICLRLCVPSSLEREKEREKEGGWSQRENCVSFQSYCVCDRSHSPSLSLSLSLHSPIPSQPPAPPPPQTIGLVVCTSLTTLLQWDSGKWHQMHTTAWQTGHRGSFMDVEMWRWTIS